MPTPRRVRHAAYDRGRAALVGRIPQPGVRVWSRRGRQPGTTSPALWTQARGRIACLSFVRSPPRPPFPNDSRGRTEQLGTERWSSNFSVLNVSVI